MKWKVIFFFFQKEENQSAGKKNLGEMQEITKKPIRFMHIGPESNSVHIVEKLSNSYHHTIPTHQKVTGKKFLPVLTSRLDLSVSMLYVSVENDFITHKPFLSFLDFLLEMKAWEDLIHFQALQLVMQKTPH